MRITNTKFLGFALTVAALFMSGCNVDWVWDTSPDTSRDVSGTIAIVDSLHQLLPGALSGIPVTLIKYGYPYNVLDSAVTDVNGAWSMPNAPLGDFEVLALKPGYSVFLDEVTLNGKYATSISGEIAPPMKHAVVIDSIIHIVRYGQDTSIGIYGHDPAMTSSNGGLDILLCFDTTRSIPGSGQHLISSLAEIYGDIGRGNSGAFEGELPLNGNPISGSTTDTLYLVAYAINPLEGEDWVDPSGPPQAVGYRTCGPRSNVIAIPRK